MVKCPPEWLVTDVAQKNNNTEVDHQHHKFALGGPISR